MPKIYSALQSNKAIPVLLEIRDNTKSTPDEIKEVRKTADATLSEIKGLPDDIGPGSTIGASPQ